MFAETSGAVQLSAGSLTLDTLTVGTSAGSVSGVFELSADGTLNVDDEVVVMNAGRFTQTGGDIDGAGSDLKVLGTYNHSGGDSFFSSLWLRDGAYNLSGDGVCTFGIIYAGRYSGDDGKFDMSGGTCTVNGDVYTGYENGASGEVEISGGTLTVARLRVGHALVSSGTALLNIRDDDATIGVEEKLRFGKRSTLTVASGKFPTIKMTDTAAAFEIDEDATGTNLELTALKLVFEGAHGTDVKTIEAAGVAVSGDDAPDSSSDFNTGNFALGELVVGKETGPADDYGPDKIELLDAEDNRTGSEAVYVKVLTIAAGGTFDQDSVNDYPLYYLKGTDPNRLFMGDANLNGYVGLLDLTILANNWDGEHDEDDPPPGRLWSDADFNGDRWVDLLDLTVLSNNWERGDDPERDGGGLPKLEDVDGDGDFDIDDVRIILKRWEEQQ